MSESGSHVLLSSDIAVLFVPTLDWSRMQETVNLLLCLRGLCSSLNCGVKADTGCGIEPTEFILNFFDIDMT
jgi:hypothetical protein